MSEIKKFEGIELFEQTFRQQINKDSGKIENLDYLFKKKFGDGPDEWPIEPNRYRLIWMPGCPHSNKAVITWKLLGLNRVISLATAGILRTPKGWVFSEDENEEDPVLKVHYLHDIYTRTHPDYTGRSTVPTIADTQTGTAANNEPVNIPTYFATSWKPYHKENAPDLYPEDLRGKIDKANEWVTKEVNAYKCGFARSQGQYENGYDSYFDTLEKLDKHLAENRFLFGDYITLTDIHLYVALVRFYMVYYLVFRVNKKRLEDFENLWGYARDLYQTDGFRDYTKFDLIKKHYQLSPHLRALFGNEHGIYALGPDVSKWELPHGREKLSKDISKFRYEKEERLQFQHTDEKLEEAYIEEYLLNPIEQAGKATDQGEYERNYHLVFDELKELDERLGRQKYLLGEKPVEVDKKLYQILLRLDNIYYFVFKLDKAHIRDYVNLKRYVNDLTNIPVIAESIDVVKEREKFYRNQSKVRNPYHLIAKGPELQ
ncbi:MAG: hypothetical protein HDR03_13980 [Lachnospiraceae bacterium]|nr:hypothetical protein [Lachnospiraceae bacterium]